MSPIVPCWFVYSVFSCRVCASNGAYCGASICSTICCGVRPANGSVLDEPAPVVDEPCSDVSGNDLVGVGFGDGLVVGFGRVTTGVVTFAPAGLPYGGLDLRSAGTV
jgi:hypothetical protein